MPGRAGTREAQRLAAISGPDKPLIAEPCHFPEGWNRFMQVEPGATVTAILPVTDGYGGKLGFVITTRQGRILVGPLTAVTPGTVTPQTAKTVTPKTVTPKTAKTVQPKTVNPQGR